MWFNTGIYWWHQVLPLKVCGLTQLEPRVISPNITLYHGSEGDFPSSPVKLLCTLSGFYPDKLTVSWAVDDQPLQYAVPLETRLQSTQGSPTFTMTSEMKTDMEAWQKGSSYKCTANHYGKLYNKTINICHLIQSVPPVVHLEMPSFQALVTGDHQITARCFVHIEMGPSIVWLLDGTPPDASQIEDTSNSTHIISTLRMSSNRWKKVSVVTCRAKHLCLQSTEESGHMPDMPATLPVVSIRRSLPDLVEGNSAVLECAVTNLSSSDLYITFQSNGKDISSKDFIQLKDSSGLRSISTRFSIPKDYWQNDKHISCRVNQGFSHPVSSIPTGNIFVDPSLKLLLAPSEQSGAQMLLCTAWGFKPHIEWRSGDQKISGGSEASISLNSDGRVVVSSQLPVSPADWKRGKEFSCQVSDESLNKKINEVISVCTGHVKAPAVIHVETPSFQTVEMASSEISASCWVCTAFEATVSWWMDGKAAQSQSMRQYRNSSHIISELTLPQMQWKTLRQVVCKAEHQCLRTTEKMVRVEDAPVSLPVVSIRRSLPDLVEGNSAVLECAVTNLSSSDLYITFQSNGKDISSKDFIQLKDSSGLRSISTRFSIPKDYWQNDKHISCRVNQGFSHPVSSIPTGNIFVDPSLKLLLAPSEQSGAQMLLCTAWGFNPHIEWRSGDQKISGGSEASISLNSDGRVVVSSQLPVSPADWKRGKEFSCQVSDESLNKKINEVISVCTGHVKAPAVIHVETPSFQTVEKASSEISASCWVCTAFEATVSWWMDGKAAQSQSMRQYRNSSHIISELTLPQMQWKTLRQVVCKAEHQCLRTTEKMVRVEDAPVSLPVVSIRRSLPDFVEGNSAVLECAVTNLSSSDLYITFQSNGKDISSKDFIQLKDSSGLRSISTRFSIPKDYWQNDKHFSCRVNQGFSHPVSSIPTGNIFVDPSLKLLLAPSEQSGAQMLLCTAWGFNPHIEWRSGDQKISGGSEASISLNSDGRVVVSSQLPVSPADWKRGKEFSCQVSDESLNKKINEVISVCTVTPLNVKAVVVYVKGPPLEQLQNDSTKFMVSCLLVGNHLSNFIVTWKIAEKIQFEDVHTTEPVQHSNGTQTMQSFLNVSADEWNNYKQVSCEARHICSNQSYMEYTSKSRVSYPPAVKLTQPSLLGLSTLDTVSLDCLVSGFYPPNIILHWEKNGVRVPNTSSQTDAPVWKDQDGVTYLTSSRMNISSLERDSTYSCVVWHESSETPYSSTIKDVFASMIPTQPSVMLLQGNNELVCLANGFSPAHINISWFLDNSIQLLSYNTSAIFMSPDGKFSIQSRLRLSPADQLRGALHTCRVTHTTATIDEHISPKENKDVCNVLDYSLTMEQSQTCGSDSWYLACTFLLCFLVSAVYCVCATLFKTK